MVTIHGFLCNSESFLTKGFVNLVCPELTRNSLNLSLPCHFFKNLFSPYSLNQGCSSWVSQVFLWVNRSQSQIPCAFTYCQMITAHSCGKSPWICCHRYVCVSLAPRPTQSASHYLLARAFSPTHFLCPTSHTNSHVVLTELRPRSSKSNHGLRALVHTANYFPISISPSSSPLDC